MIVLHSSSARYNTSNGPNGSGTEMVTVFREASLSIGRMAPVPIGINERDAEPGFRTK